LDGTEIGRVDLYSPDLQISEEKLGWRELAAGEHTLRFESVGKTAASTWPTTEVRSVSLLAPSPGQVFHRRSFARNVTRAIAGNRTADG
jgi:hypothetical protein